MSTVNWESLLPFCETERQKQVVELRSHGISARQVADQLGISERNVMEACARVKRKAAKHGYSPEHDMTHVVPDGFKVAVFANGCFWGSEKGIWRLPGDGIYSTAVGYCAGFTPNPTYEEACSGRTGHTEGVRVVYDPAKISFVDILRWFWEAHDPTSGMRQGNDVGTQYRSGFYYFDEEQKELIEASKAAYEKALGRPITTEIAAAADYDKYGGLWFYAEAYHQQVRPRPTLPVFTTRHPRLADGSAIAAPRSTSRRRARGPTARRSRRASPCRPSSRGRLRSCSRSTRPSCPRPSGSSTRRSAAAASCSRPTRRSSSTWRSVFRGRVPGLRAEGLGS